MLLNGFYTDLKQWNPIIKNQKLFSKMNVFKNNLTLANGEGNPWFLDYQNPLLKPNSRLRDTKTNYDKRILSYAVY